MSFGFLDVAATPAVKAVQRELGVAHLWENFPGHREFDRFTENEARFIVERDSFYMATISETSWPYVQHRGGPPGFLKMIDERTLAFADYRGNFQYITVGNLSASNKASLFLIDYPRRARLKIYVHAEVVSLDAEAALTEQVLEGTSGKPERIIRLRLETFDWNCPQHITPRYTNAELAEALAPMRARLDALTAENAALRQAACTAARQT